MRMDSSSCEYERNENAFKKCEYASYPRLLTGIGSISDVVRMGSSSSVHQRNENVFEGIAPCSLSDAYVHSPDYPSYDVFINHRGPDVKEGLAKPIYKQLASYDLRVFLDQKERRTGDFLPAKLQHALATCTVHVAIFSPTYAHSPWCLAELSYILTTRAKILPIFYDVEPSEVRYIKGRYAQAFQKYQEKQRIDPLIVHKWKQDLHNVSFVDGIVFDSSKDDEAMLLKRIVDSVVAETIGEVLDVAKHPIGLDEAFQAFQSAISMSNKQYSGSAKLVGIVGMGGIGKTTLAKKVYNETSSAYKGCCCFLSDVRLEASKSGLTSLQKKLLQKLSHYDWTIDSTSQGIQMMRSRLLNQKVLLVLDDVDNMDQIDALLVKDVLDSGSLVIVTSRDKHVLLKSGVVIFHEVKGLGENQARKLFCWHAFHLPSPLKEFEALVDKFLIACSGLPLSLKVIGALLYRKDLCYWNGTLQKMGKHILPGNIVDSLKVSFDALEREEKEIFLDIACFFAGEEKNKLIRIWDGSEWSSMQSLENLEQKCLIEFAHQNEGYKNRGEENGVLIRMHDHLRDMGRSVIENQSQPSRLWRADDIGKYFWRIQHEMVAEVRGICGSPAPSFSPICNDTRGPCSSSSSVSARALKLLQTRGDYLITEFNYLLRHLIWLRWYDSYDANALSQLWMPNLRVLELFDVHFDWTTLLQGHNQVPIQLRELFVRIRYTGFVELPKSIGFLRNLEKIVLHHGTMRTLPDELCQLLLLKHLDLRHCESLQLLPSGFGNLRNLRHLELTGCLGLEALPNSFSQLTQLQYLSLLNCKQLMVPVDILRNIGTLEYLDLSLYGQETLPTHITNQKFLRNLYVVCPSLKELPVDMDGLSNLRVLRVASNTMTALPSSLKCLSSLKSLNLSRCVSLQCLPESIAQFQALEDLNLNFTAIKVLPQGVAHLRNLINLYAYLCPLGDLMLSIPRDEERPIDSFAKAMVRLQSLDMRSTKITKLGIATDVCPNLEILDISDCISLIQVEALPITLVNLNLSGCERLKKVQGLQNLTRLRYFNISGCFELQELEDLSESRFLERLTADGCCMLKKMEGLQHLQHLERVQIDAWTAGVWKEIKCLKELPSKVCNITLNMQTVGSEEIQVYEILNSLGFPISVYDLQIRAECTLEPSEVTSCSGLIIILLCESGNMRYDPGHEFLRLRNQNSMQEQRVFVRMKSECQCIILSMFRKGSRFLRELEQIEMDIDNNRLSENKGWVVLVKDEEEWKMREIWEKLFSYAYRNRAFKEDDFLPLIQKRVRFGSRVGEDLGGAKEEEVRCMPWRLFEKRR